MYKVQFNLFKKKINIKIISVSNVFNGYPFSISCILFFNSTSIKLLRFKFISYFGNSIYSLVKTLNLFYYFFINILKVIQKYGDDLPSS